MLGRTHLAIGIFAILLFVPQVTHKASFVIVALIATMLPDADSAFSTIGRRKTLRPVQMFVKHRGLFHSFTFLILITFFFVLFLPIVALPFFLGYSLHIFADSFTIEGIRPFYPHKKSVSGRIRTGSRFETGFLVGFVLADIAIFIVQIGRLF